MEKSPDAFRTISEVAELLETPAHVLRFWESRFPQIRPVKRAGGRRYYRPADVALLTGIKRLLHDDGMTIRGVQKILREQGVKHVSGVTEDTGADDDAALEAALAALGGDARETRPLPAAEAETAQIIALQTALTPPPDAMAAAITPAEGEDTPPEASTGGQDTAEPTAATQQEGLAKSEPPLAKPDTTDPEAAEPQAVEPEVAGKSVFWHGSAEPLFDPAVQDTQAQDLFAHSTKASPTAASNSPPPAQDRSEDPAQDEVEEAPMTVWAEPDELDTPPEAHVTRFALARAAPPVGEDSATLGEPASGPDHPDSSSPAPATTVTEEPVAQVTLASRLRAQKPETLSAQKQATAHELREAARALRQRMAAPVRPNL